MSRKKIPRSTLYLLATILGVGLILLSLYVLILAIRHGVAFKIGLQIIQLGLWSVYTVIYFRLYKKETASI